MKRTEPRSDKVAAVGDIKQKLEQGQSIVLADYRGLDVKATNDLRRRLKEAGVEFKVIKNTLALRAAREVGLDGLEPHLAGPTALAVGYDDPVTAAKLLNEFAKTFKQLEIKAGVVEGKIIDADGVKGLADLPSREQLLAMVAAGMQGPVRGFVFALSGMLRNLVYALDAVRRQKEEGGTA